MRVYLFSPFLSINIGNYTNLRLKILKKNCMAHFLLLCRNAIISLIKENLQIQSYISIKINIPLILIG